MHDCKSDLLLEACLHTLAEIEAALNGVDQHIAIGEKNDAHINEENCENERPNFADATQWEDGPRGETVPKSCT